MSKLYCQLLPLLKLFRVDHVTTAVKKVNLFESKLKKNGENKTESKKINVGIFFFLSSLQDRKTILFTFHYLVIHLIFIEYLPCAKE